MTVRELLQSTDFACVAEIFRQEEEDGVYEAGAYVRDYEQLFDQLKRTSPATDGGRPALSVGVRKYPDGSIYPYVMPHLPKGAPLCEIIDAEIVMPEGFAFSNASIVADLLYNLDAEDPDRVSEFLNQNIS